MAQSWRDTKTSKSSVKFKKFRIMRSICITLLSVFVSISVFSQITTDTTYTNQWNTKAKAWEQFHRTITAAIEISSFFVVAEPISCPSSLTIRI